MHATAAPSTIRERDESARPMAIARWLLAVAALVVLMVIVGGITRLTESGLSITEWRPVTGAIPPLTDADWQEAFALYRATPEFIQVTGPAGMDLAGFKFIFFWEWLHRQLGRLIGLAFALPLAWFAIRRAIPSGYGWKLVSLLLLGGAQGALGWYMVMSGLVDRTDVSHFRLSAHLLLALAIIAALVWVALDLIDLDHRRDSRPARLVPIALPVIVILFVQLLFGAWMAGLNAGQVANSWPMMNGGLVPAGIDWSPGIGFALTHDPYLIHFVHRWWAVAAAVAVIVLAGRVKAAGVRPASIALHATLGVQLLLGILTVLTGVALWLAVMHQAVGALLVAAVAWGLHALGRAGPQAAQ